MKRIVKIFGTLLAASTLSACNDVNVNAARKTFGNFGYNGVFLQEYAVKQITLNEAKGLVRLPTSLANKKRSTPSQDSVQKVLSNYASLTTIVKYYVSNQTEQQVRKDIYQGTDFKNLLETNHYEPFGQMNVRYIFVDDELLDETDQENEEFKETEQYLVSPFNEPYTYHTDENDHLILQTHHFAELPASTGGGIGSTFRQDCELIFDEEGKISFWQSSLGLYTSTPTGTVRQGYIFEVDFEWTSK